MASPRVGYGVFQSTHPSGVRRPPSRRPASDVYFNPRTPVGCDHDYQGLLPCVGYFNPRTPVGCDCSPSAIGRPSRDFNPRTPVGCDIVGDDVVPDALISIHAPQWGATRGRWRRSNAIRFQSTHPSGVRQPFLPRVKMHVEISIHAPQWGATIPQDYINRYGRISIHAPQWGATRNGVSDAAYRCYFNPRTPVGCDDRRQGEHHRPGISIHAPQWGATCPSSSLLVLVIVFQSTHPSGVRRAPITKVRQARYFNPRTPVGCDLPTAPPLFDANNFNPRTPVGCDRRPAIAGDPQRPISIHAPQWGATRRNGAKAAQPAGFQSTHPSGVRRFPLVVALGRELFQSTHPSGVRPPSRSANPMANSYFNPRTPVGCDAVQKVIDAVGVEFQSTHPSGVRQSSSPGVE